MGILDDIGDFLDDTIDNVGDIMSDTLEFTGDIITKGIDLVGEIATESRDFIEEHEEVISLVLKNTPLGPISTLASSISTYNTLNNVSQPSKSLIGEISKVNDFTRIIGKQEQINFNARSALELYNLYLKKLCLSHSVALSERQIGDHLVTNRNLYTHHGIYIGNDEVIHYSGFANGISNGEIEITTLSSFTNGERTFVKRYAFPKYKGNQVVERAKSRLGEDLYNVLLNNCEHFAYWCVMGKHHSEQIDSITSVTSLVGLIK